MSSRESIISIAAMALKLTQQPWRTLSLSDDPDVSANEDLEVIAERLASLLLVRVVAAHPSSIELYSDLSTTTICRETIKNGHVWPIPEETMLQLHDYVRTIISGYNDVPYHNREHAYHVTLSTNKLIDLMLNPQNFKGCKTPTTFGLRRDPMAHLSMIFAALVHDVEHRGIPNKQLSIEKDPLAILYNDQSIAEHRSLYIAFSELLKDDYEDLRSIMFVNDDLYDQFRTHVLNLVLTTDLASPNRSKLNKAKWDEAFGDPFEEQRQKPRAGNTVPNTEELVPSLRSTSEGEDTLSLSPVSSVEDMDELELNMSGHTAETCDSSFSSSSTTTSTKKSIKKLRFKEQKAIMITPRDEPPLGRKLLSGASLPDGLHTN